jgi:hypothetical protein
MTARSRQIVASVRGDVPKEKREHFDSAEHSGREIREIKKPQ